MKTILGERHAALGAKMIDFCDWQMPLSYKGIIAEHVAVRQQAGIFDVSHMGRVIVQGKEAAKFLDYLSTNAIANKPLLSATYTVLCNEKGGSVDDVIIYRQGPEKFFLIVNACNRAKDLNHLKKYASNFAVEIQDRYQEDGILAIQGPEAKRIMSEIFAEAASLKPMHFVPLNYQGQEIILSATGYTGAGGYEVYAPNEMIKMLWQKIVDAGVMPCGLGARDTLRLEMGYALYGHELSDEIAPTESVSAWTIKWDRNFLGKEELQKLENSSTKRFQYGILLQEAGIAREGYLVFKDAKQIGRVTSGTHSPSLNKGIAIILVQSKLVPGDQVEVQIRNTRCPALVVPLPFITSGVVK